MRNYGQALKEHRKANNLSQTELAKATGIFQQNISAWENNTYIPNIETCEILADFYGITLDDLIGREIPKNWGNYFDQRNNKGTITNNIK